MKIKDIEINGIFKTASGEVFQKISMREKGKRQNSIMVKKVTTGQMFTEAEFENLLIEYVKINPL